MSTSDVAGYGVAKTDKLQMGGWLEAKDGSLALVESTENGRVIFSVFDVQTSPITEYRDAMVEADFQKYFSDNPDWIYHDKTAFPWDRIIKQGSKSGLRVAAADDVIEQADKITTSRQRFLSPSKNAATRVAQDLALRGQELVSDKAKKRSKTDRNLIVEIKSMRDRLDDMLDQLDA